MKNICVYCGSSPGNRTEYILGAKKLGIELVKQNIGLVYGGGNIGIMGEIAKAVMEEGGSAIGVIPSSIAKKIPHHDLTELHIVDSMHERKQRMFELSDGFIGLPGGFGTLEELFEILTWSQLGYHKKPCGVLNIGNYFDQLLAFLDHSVTERFVTSHHRKMLLVSNESKELLKNFSDYEAPEVDKWMK